MTDDEVIDSYKRDIRFGNEQYIAVIKRLNVLKKEEDLFLEKKKERKDTVAIEKKIATMKAEIAKFIKFIQ